jgi:hypothetical protein
VRALPASLVAAADRRVDGVVADRYEDGGLNVRFADRENGWIYGGLAVPARLSGVSYAAIEAVLWSTHDGGVSWQREALSGLGLEGSIFDLEAADGTAYLMESSAASGVTVKSSPVALDRWRVTNTVRLGSPAGGGGQSGAFVLQGSSGWLVAGNDRGTTGSARLENDGRWVAWTPPCAFVGHSFAIPAASTTRDLVAVCVIGGFAYPLSKSAPRGAKLGSLWLYFSSDGGGAFDAGPELASSDFASYGVLASPAPGTLLIGHSVANQQDLIESFDRGRHWTVVYPSEPFFLAFTNPRQGFAIVGTPGAATTLIMSLDGGRHWARVSF